MKKVLVLQGPNLNMIGIREKSIYGEESSEDIRKQILLEGEKYGFNCEIFQSNWEGALIDKIHESRKNFNGIIINAGALAHYSLSLRDAISCIKIPCIDVHMSNIYARDEFRKKSLIAEVCAGQIVGFGKNVYFLALAALYELI